MSGEAIFRYPDASGPDSFISESRTYSTNGKRQVLGFLKLKTASWNLFLYQGKIYYQRERAPWNCRLRGDQSEFLPGPVVCMWGGAALKKTNLYFICCKPNWNLKYCHCHCKEWGDEAAVTWPMWLTSQNGDNLILYLYTGKILR